MPTAATWSIIGWVVSATAILLFIVWIVPLANLCLQSWFSGCGVNFWDILGMRLRGLDAAAITWTHIRLSKARVYVEIKELETHAHVGGSLQAVATAVITAKMNNWNLGFRQACELDLASIDCVDFVTRVQAGGLFDDASVARVLATMKPAEPNRAR